MVNITHSIYLQVPNSAKHEFFRPVLYAPRLFEDKTKGYLVCVLPQSVVRVVDDRKRLDLLRRCPAASGEKEEETEPGSENKFFIFYRSDSARVQNICVEASTIMKSQISSHPSINGHLWKR